MNALDDTRKSLMLWNDDFANEHMWESICKVLGIPEDTEEVELKCDVIAHFSYKH